VTRRTGLLVDYGGVLTTDLFHSFAAFCSAEGLDPQALRGAFAGDKEAARMLVAFEKGRLDEAEFEVALAGKLGVAPERLIDRLFAGISADVAMVEAVATAKRAGIRCGLLSNSWGHRYDRTRWEELFHATVISGEVGIRKPDADIYVMAAERLGLPPQEIVFVDDIPHNLTPAEALGMATVHHTDAAKTIAELEDLLGVGLSPA
jgi:putative hydrolase of the HAD superfamily